MKDSEFEKYRDGYRKLMVNADISEIRAQKHVLTKFLLMDTIQLKSLIEDLHAIEMYKTNGPKNMVEASEIFKLCGPRDIREMFDKIIKEGYGTEKGNN